MFQFAIPITEDCYFAELLGIIPVPVFQFAIPITEDCYFLSPIEQRQESGFNSQSPLLRIVIPALTWFYQVKIVSIRNPHY